VQLQIRDNGKGFNPALQYDGSGLIGMRERARRIGGELAIESSPGGGTEIRVALSRKIRVLIADDHPVVREGLAAILNRQEDMVVVGEAGNGSKALEQWRRHRPDITFRTEALSLAARRGLIKL
jgi:response regulator receiver domain-containing protein